MSTSAFSDIPSASLSSDTSIFEGIPTTLAPPKLSSEEPNTEISGANPTTSIATISAASSPGLVSYTPAPSPAANTANVNEKSSAVAVIAGSVVGSVAALAIITLTVIFLLRRRDRARSRSMQRGVITPLAEGTESFFPITQPVKSTGNTGSSIRQEKDSQPAASHRISHLPEPPSLLGDATDSTIAPSDSGESRSMQPIVARLEFLQNTMAWMVEHVQRLESRRDYEESSMTGRSDAPPPTYVSE
ncbi:hypothetical protein GYMLUDRAFT_263889 [Collybiopsis luxurians FD-317 M1]|uniref:receptor protein-tyrosine kinase n=1 Tax=Collybiopsis luxurians FD-317 M1 TaxID=944289 RepID=A0A0D0AZ11_9AGAR|nr:hypothetical protein GYMLUDRAFT_263889 [Collybiopsis luxurians FD-317 M1]